MKRLRFCSIVPFFALAAFLLLIPIMTDSLGLAGQNGSRKSAATPVQTLETQRARIEAAYGQLPLSFEPNQGQTAEQVKFLSRGRGYSLFLTGDEAVLALAAASKDSPGESMKASTALATAKSEVLRMKLVGVNSSVKVAGLDQLLGKSNYIIGKDPTKWHTNVANYAKVRYQNVYPGIDLVYYGNQSELEYDFVVSPGANPKSITLEISGTRDSTPASIADNGDLVIKAEGGEIRFHKPAVYQVENTSVATPNKKPVEGRFVVLAKNQIGFEVPSYDSAKPLYIDPVISYSTYLGNGEPANSSPQPWAIKVDSAGNAYLTGGTASPDFPVTAGTFDTTPASYTNAFVTKLSPNGSALIYSTFLGGSGRDVAYGFAVDDAGNAYLSGFTDSSDFPTLNAFQERKGGEPCDSSQYSSRCYDAFVSKLNSTGSALLYSTYLGGSDFEDLAVLALDQTGNVYVAGGTTSTDFPTLNPIQQNFRGDCQIIEYGETCEDTFIAKINPSAGGAASLLYSTYLGGDGSDWVYSIAVDGGGNAYVAGYTSSSDYPTTPGALQNGTHGGFVSKIDAEGSALAYSALIGGTQITSIAVDASGSGYITGVAMDGLPTTPGAFETNCGGGGQCQGGFVAKLNPAGSQFVYSTYLKGSNWDLPMSIAVDSMGIAYVTGYASSLDFPLANAVYSSCRVNGGYCDDAFLTKLSANGEGLIFSTYIGGSGSEIGVGVAIDPSRNAYLAGLTSSTDFPVSSGAYQQTPPVGVSGFVVKFSDIVLPAIVQSAPSLNFVSQDIGTTSPAQTVAIKNVGDAASDALSFNIAGDFNFTQTCTTGIAPGEGCSMDVTFTPQAAGVRTGEVKKYNAATGQWDPFLSLTGFGGSSSLAIAPSNLTFDDQLVGTVSTAKTLTVTNAGSTDVNIASMTASANFAYTSKCGNSLPAAAQCTISVTFVPKSAGRFNEEIIITHDGAGSPYAIPVSGKGTDFSVGPASGTGNPTASVTAGQTATYNLSVSPAGYTGTVALACQWNVVKPTGAECSVTPSGVSLDGTNSANVIVSVTTRARSMAPVRWEPKGPQPLRDPVTQLAMWGLGLALLASLAMRRRRIFLTLSSALFMVALWAACGGGVVQPTPVSGTTAGTYSLSLTATAGAVTKTTTMTLQVQ